MRVFFYTGKNIFQTEMVIFYIVKTDYGKKNSSQMAKEHILKEADFIKI